MPRESVSSRLSDSGGALPGTPLEEAASTGNASCTHELAGSETEPLTGTSEGRRAPGEGWGRPRC